MKKFIALVGPLFLVACAQQNAQQSDNATQTPQTPTYESFTDEVHSRIGAGWNLGNQMDAYNDGVSEETAWANPVCTQALFDSLKADGFNSVRIPVTWLGHIGDAPDYKIDDAWLGRVEEIVGYAEKSGLTAIINVHHDGAEGKHWLDIKGAAKNQDIRTKVNDEIRALWSQIATKFKDKGDFLIFESFNEIHDGKWGWGENRVDSGAQYAVLNDWNQIFVDAVRATGGNNKTRILGVPGYCTNKELTLESFVLPKDSANRIALAVHYYEPYEYTLECQYPAWGKNNEGSKPEYGDEDYMDESMAKLEEKFVKNGVPIYIGETGCARRSDPAEEANRIYYLKTLAETCNKHKMSAIYWDNGYHGTGREQSGLYDRQTGACVGDGQDVVRAFVGGFK